MSRMALANVKKECGQAIEVAAEDLAHHEAFLLQGDAGEVGRLAGELRRLEIERTAWRQSR